MLQNRFLIESDSPKWGNREYISYTKIRKGRIVKTHPVILYLGTWKRVLKNGLKRDYWCAIELNNLDTEQMASLKYYLSDILEQKTIKARYRKGKELLPDIFVQWYRTYRIENIGSRIKGQLYSLDVRDVDEAKADEYAREETGEKLSTFNPEQQSDWISRAVRERGKEEEEQQIAAAAERRKDSPRTSPEPQAQPEMPQIDLPDKIEGEDEQPPKTDSPAMLY